MKMFKLKMFGRCRTRRKKIVAFGLLSFLFFCFMQSSMIQEHLIDHNFFCSLLVSDESEDIRTEVEYQKMDFNFTWTPESRFWDSEFEKRYLEKQDFPLKVFILPHSHNDPGWKQRPDDYFDYQTKNILNNAVERMSMYKDMTFAWTEMYFLAMWWDQASDVQKSKLETLIQEQRFEILTGGWVMTDEANVHIYAMLDQLIEGQQWMTQTFGVYPNSSWSLDPFGHSSTQAYVLKASGIKAMAIMRIHRAWKVHLARQRGGDFYWRQSWDLAKEHDILCHVFPYDLYSTRDSCGPNRQICLQFYFGTPNGFSTDYSQVVVNINNDNVEERAKLLLEQYGKTGSLYPHNVIVVPLGEDFTLAFDDEWNFQYGNYSLLMKHINANPEKYKNTEIKFGTMSEYFAEVEERSKLLSKPLQTVKGDFFVYSDDRSPVTKEHAYWSGYFTTRPYMKWLSRQVENNLRSAEILYTMAWNKAEQRSHKNFVVLFEHIYAGLVKARRNLALFQHHDAITGTCTRWVMRRYEEYLWESILQSQIIHKSTLLYILAKSKSQIPNNNFRPIQNIYDPKIKGLNNNSLVPIVDVEKGELLAVFNSATRIKRESISFLIKAKKRQKKKICVQDKNGIFHQLQFGPYFNSSEFLPNPDFISVTFVTRMNPLSITTFKIGICGSEDDDGTGSNPPTVIRCLKCLNIAVAKQTHNYVTKTLALSEEIRIENFRQILKFDKSKHFLSHVIDKASGSESRLEFQIGAYPTLATQNGAYIFMRDPDQTATQNIMNIADVTVVEGPIFSEVITMYGSANSSAFRTSVRIYHDNEEDSRGIQIENFLDLGDLTAANDLDVFGRLNTDIENRDENGKPYFFSDLNGLQMQKRVQVDGVSLEGHFYPVTSMAYLEDDNMRLTLVVDHAQGVASLREGSLEFIIDRRASKDDGRGLEEAIMDMMPMTHKYKILLEIRYGSGFKNVQSLPSESAHLASNHLNYPSLCYVTELEDSDFESEHQLISHQLPCHQHMVNLRTMSRPNVNLPSRSALLILQHQAADCGIQGTPGCSAGVHFQFKDLQVTKMMVTGLTGLHYEREITSIEELDLQPVELRAVKIDF